MELANRQETELARRLLGLVGPILPDSRVRWESAHVAHGKVASATRARQLVAQALSDEGLRRELASAVRELGGMRSPILWDHYFKVYDKVVLFSGGYQELLWNADLLLPRTGTIGDFGAGTGNFSAALLHSHPTRKLISLDSSREGLQQAQKKLKRICRAGGRFSLILAPLQALDSLGLEALDGAVMNNVLYTLSPEDRSAVLRAIFKLLKPGGVLILNDPTPHGQGSREALSSFLTQLACDAVEAGAFLTEQELALLVFINEKALFNGGHRFLDSRELSDLALEKGFQIAGRRPAYYRICTSLFLRRPASLPFYRQAIAHRGK